ncbi:MAG: GTP pyrophosphokinase, partial [Paramuribaculum sp.]|nr:GTP pyrophosphokinase [Paramuribaculum sp.]
RILSTKWEEVNRKFLAEIHIEGVDRHGILQELTQMISNQLNIDIRSLHIDTEQEVFECRLTVMVNDTAVVNELCSKVSRIKGITTAARVGDHPVEE